MHLKLLLATLVLYTAQNLYSQRNYDNGSSKIKVTLLLPPDYTEDSILFQVRDANYISIRPDWKNIVKKIKTNRATISFNGNKPIFLATSLFQNVFEPGDDVIIKITNERPVYSGKGIQKLILIDEIKDVLNTKLKVENPEHYTARSIEDYWEWDRALSMQIQLTMKLVDSFKTNVSPFAYQYIKSMTLADIEDHRFAKFLALSFGSEKLGVSKSMLCKIFDYISKLQSSQWLVSSKTHINHVYYYYDYVRLLLQRQYDFNLAHDSLKDEATRKLYYYNLGQRKLHGNVLENYLTYLITEAGIKELGFPKEIEQILADYYSKKGKSVYTDYVRGKEATARKDNVDSGRLAPKFSLSDIHGRLLTNGSIENKLTVLAFWNQVPSKNSELISFLQSIEREYSFDSSIVIINILENSAKLGKAETELFTDNKGSRIIFSKLDTGQTIKKEYNVSNTPKLYIIDANGRFITTPVTTYSPKVRKELMGKIEEQMGLMNDGPYVFEENDSLHIHYLKGKSITLTKLPSNTSNLNIRIPAINMNIDIHCGTSYPPEPAEFPECEKLFCVSDIEGNFQAFNRLLVSNGIIDKQGNWTFGSGHLVCLGDFFDRGQQVTELLWFIYQLEEKAKKQGGYVHFLIGNHEIMNLSGDLRYNHAKYKSTAKLLGKSYNHLYGRNTTLGKWLRSKNVIEKIGNNLFVHGGISTDINNLDISISKINQIAQSYYDRQDEARNSTDTALIRLFDFTVSPHWYREYYLKTAMRIRSNGDTLVQASKEQVIATLNKFKVNQIITGHSIIADTITTHYQGHVINIDTRHALGQSEGLLILNAKYYRVSNTGKAILLSLPVNTYDGYPSLNQR